MPVETVNLKLVPIALAEVDTTAFERFGQAFHAALMGRAFIPLGGIHDGGAEGYMEPELWSDSAAKHFLQVSKQSTFRTKIRKTVNRLREYGRMPSSVTYIFSDNISDIDNLEDALSEELNTRIKIRDAKYIETQINFSDATVEAFNSFLRPFLSHLFIPGNANVAPQSSAYTDRTLAVFLRQEVDNRRGKSELLESVTDSLIIWALSDTDPEKGVFATSDEILVRIETALPSTRQFIRGVLDVRLERLRDKQNTDGRQIRYYRAKNNYCLPYETRQIIAEENINDLSLKNDADLVLARRFNELSTDNQRPLLEIVKTLCHSVLEKIFERQGLLVAQFAVDGDIGDELYANVADLVAEVVEARCLGESGPLVRQLTLRILRGTFYDSTEEERLYLQQLSKTYVLLLLIKNEPKVVEYFRSLSSHFELYIGTDFIVRALSEHYLDPDNQTTHNLLRTLKNAGSRLILTEKVVEEVASHLRAQILEFENVYAYIENKIEVDIIEYIDRILIRAYFYSRLAPMSTRQPPAGWRSYIEQFGSYAEIKAGRAAESIARYLIQKFGMEYESTTEMKNGIDEGDVEILAKAIADAKSSAGRAGDNLDIRAYNDALHVYRVYRRRILNNESSPMNPFGFKTWWLTQDGTVRRASGKVIAANNSNRFMMRPEFLLNYIYLTPSKKEIEGSFKTIFPSILGVRLSNRVATKTFRDVIKSANDIWAVDEARSAAIITDLTNNLKGDNIKVYENIWDEAL